MLFKKIVMLLSVCSLFLWITEIIAQDSVVAIVNNKNKQKSFDLKISHDLGTTWSSIAIGKKVKQKINTFRGTSLVGPVYIGKDGQDSLGLLVVGKRTGSNDLLLMTGLDHINNYQESIIVTGDKLANDAFISKMIWVKNPKKPCKGQLIGIGGDSSGVFVVSIEKDNLFKVDNWTFKYLLKKHNIEPILTDIATNDNGQVIITGLDSTRHGIMCEYSYKSGGQRNSWKCQSPGKIAGVLGQSQIIFMGSVAYNKLQKLWYAFGLLQDERGSSVDLIALTKKEADKNWQMKTIKYTPKETYLSNFLIPIQSYFTENGYLFLSLATVGQNVEHSFSLSQQGANQTFSLLLRDIDIKNDCIVAEQSQYYSSSFSFLRKSPIYGCLTSNNNVIGVQMVNYSSEKSEKINQKIVTFRAEPLGNFFTDWYYFLSPKQIPKSDDWFYINKKMHPVTAFDIKKYQATFPQDKLIN